MLTITTDRIKQVLSQGKELIQTWRANRELEMGATVDHIEVGETHLTLGVDVSWLNKTQASIEIYDVQIKLYMSKLDEHPTRIYATGRFERIPGQKVIKKLPIVGPFVLPPGVTHIEHLRFQTRAILDIKEGIYPLEILVHDTQGPNFTQQTSLVVDHKHRYRLSREWHGN